MTNRQHQKHYQKTHLAYSKKARARVDSFQAEVSTVEVNSDSDTVCHSDISKKIEQLKEHLLSRSETANFIEIYCGIKSEHPDLIQQTAQEKKNVICRHCNLRGHERRPHKECLKNPKVAAAVPDVYIDTNIRTLHPIESDNSEDGITSEQESDLD